MGLQKGDVLDEAKKGGQSCRVAIRVLEGGAGFTKVNCCGLEITEAEKADSVDASIDRFPGESAKPGVIIDESKNNPNSCGLKVEIAGGGGGFESITCCGNTLTVENDAV